MQIIATVYSAGRGNFTPYKFLKINIFWKFLVIFHIMDWQRVVPALSIFKNSGILVTEFVFCRL